MTVKYGFFNSVAGDRKYNATDFANLFNGIVTDGVFLNSGDHLAVSPQTGSNMYILIASGRAWFNGTWTYNDANLAIAVDASESVLNRIDAVILEVDTSDAVRANSIKMLKGTPATTPTNPTMTHTATKNQYALAYIYVGATVTAITAPNITNNIGLSGCPYSTALLETVTVDTLLAQWEAQFDVWFDNLVDQLSGSQVTNLQSQIDTLTYVDLSLSNYIITPSISSNNLVLAIKTLAGIDPTATTPIQIKVGNTKYSITNAVSFTKNAGTNYGNAGSAELATKDVDWFLYAIQETGASAGLKFGYSRLPFATTMGDLVSSATSEKAIIGNYTNFNSADIIRVIGRFRARLSAGAGYTWSIPTVKVVNYPIYETDVLDFVPTITYSGGTTNPTSNVITAAKYHIIGRSIKIHIETALTRGTGDRTITTMTIPYSAWAGAGTNPANCLTNFTSAGLAATTGYISGNTVVFYNNSAMIASGNYWATLTGTSS